MCVYLLGFYKSVQDMGWYFRMNLHLPIHILWHYQTAMSARKRLNANISCHPTEANGLSNKLLYLESMAWWHSRFSLSIVFSIADESEKVRFELPSLPVMLEKKMAAMWISTPPVHSVSFPGILFAVRVDYVWIFAPSHIGLNSTPAFELILICVFFTSWLVLFVILYSHM